jgi:hypothetical protein
MNVSHTQLLARYEVDAKMLVKKAQTNQSRSNFVSIYIKWEGYASTNWSTTGIGYQHDTSRGHSKVPTLRKYKLFNR